MADLTRAQLDLIDAVLPPPPTPAAVYVPVREVRGLLHVAGQTPHVDGRLDRRGAVGSDVTPEEARGLARLAALNALSALRAHLGDLRRLDAIVSVTVYIAAAPDFRAHPAVADGASALFRELLGEAGRHARAAVGVASLPDGATVEIGVVAALASD